MRTIGNFARPAPGTDHDLDVAEAAQRRDPPPVPRISGTYRRLSPDDERLLAAARTEIDAIVANAESGHEMVVGVWSVRAKLREVIREIADRTIRARAAGGRP